MAKAKELWYNSPLFVAIVTIIIGFSVNVAFKYYEKVSNKSDSNNSLKSALRGEISGIKGAFQERSIEVQSALKKGVELNNYRIVYPRKIYDSNLGNIGNIKESDLAEAIVELYSWAERIDNMGEQFNNGIYKKENLAGYAAKVAAVWTYSIMVYNRLQNDTKENDNDTLSLKFNSKLEKEFAYTRKLSKEIYDFLNIQDSNKIKAMTK